MSANETQSQDSITVIITSDGAEVIDDIPDWERPFTKCNRYGEPTGYNYIRCSAYGAEILDGGMSTASHRLACRHE